MKRTEILQRTVNAIQHRDRSHTGRFWLCYLNGELKCVPAGKGPPPEIAFTCFNNCTLDTGLTSKQWNCLEGLIYKTLHQKGYV